MRLDILSGAILCEARNILPIVVCHFLLDFFSTLVALKPSEEVIETSVETASGGDYPIASIIVTYIFYSVPGIVGWLLLAGTIRERQDRT